jgi:mono/diheme cytochrome c family protein
LTKGSLVWFALFLVLPATLLMLNAVGIAPPAAPETEPPSGWLVPPVAVSTPVLEQGRRIFLRDCAHCHGPNGDGISPNVNTLHPAPFDLTSFQLTESFIRRVVREGIPGSDMPGWRLGSEKEVFAVSAYTVRLGRPDSLPEEERYAPPEALYEAGRRIYTMHCVSCHGGEGHGDGPDAAQHLPRPASFADMQPSYAAARRVIENGVHGTAMPSWPLLTAPEIQAVTFYIRALYTSSRGIGARP